MYAVGVASWRWQSAAQLRKKEDHIFLCTLCMYKLLILIWGAYYIALKEQCKPNYVRRFRNH